MNIFTMFTNAFFFAKSFITNGTRIGFNIKMHTIDVPLLIPFAIIHSVTLITGVLVPLKVQIANMNLEVSFFGKFFVAGCALELFINIFAILTSFDWTRTVFHRVVHIKNVFAQRLPMEHRFSTDVTYILFLLFMEGNKV